MKKKKLKAVKRSKKNRVEEDQRRNPMIPAGSRKREASDFALPSLVTGMAKLVERLESLERKMDQVLGKLNVPTTFARRSEPVQAAISRERTLYQAICADCQKSCEVPFRPGDRPVYCKECFTIRKSGHRTQDLEKRAVLKSSYVPTPFTASAIPSLTKAEMTVFEKSKKKKSKKKAAKRRR